MVEFYDIDTKEMRKLAILDIKEITISANGYILIDTIDGVFYQTEQINF